MNYLYNGVELPALPDYWDSNQFKHKLIILDNSEDTPVYTLICSENELRVVSVDSDGLLEYDYNGIETREGRCDYDADSGVWVGAGSGVVDSGGVERYYELIWSDYDVLKADGTTYLAKSDPVAAGSGGHANYPPFPEYDTVKYPYAAVFETLSEESLDGSVVNTMYILMVSDAKVIVDSSGLLYVMEHDSTICMWVYYDNLSTEWSSELQGFETSAGAEFGSVNDYRIIWSNYNVSSPTIDQASFLAGYKVGAELRRLRIGVGGSSIRVITWDGDTTGLVSYVGEYFKVSDNVPTKEEVIGGTYTIVGLEENPTTFIITESNVADDKNADGSNGWSIVYNSIVQVILFVPENITSGNVTLLKGVYFINTDGAYVSSLACGA